MALTDNVPVVALIVSLVALTIAFGQFSLQILSTADGYRRCSDLVIGPWARLRWRHWVWSEFRYETHFVCPEFLLCSGKDQDLENRRGIRLAESTLKDKKIPPRNRWLRLTRRSREDIEAAVRGVLGEALYPDREKQQGAQNSNNDVEKGQIKVSAHYPSQLPPSSQAPLLLREDNKTSWLVLLQEARNLYESYKSEVESGPCHLPAISRPTSAESEQSNAPKLDNTVMTEPRVNVREWVWDTMPNDVTKPLATTTLGFILVFAMRMGMTWRSIDLARSQLLADGNGYISSTEISGLGLVVKFSNLDFSKSPRLTPGQAADKLMCGILPGSRYLVDQDFHCVRNNRKEETMSVICSKIDTKHTLFNLWAGKGDISSDLKDRLGKRFAEIQNDAITLLCEYLPLPRNSGFKHYFWGWLGNRWCVFKFYESRFAFWRRLKCRKKKGTLTDTLSNVFDYMNYLQNQYKDDAYGLNNSLAAAAESGRNDKKKKQKQSDLQRDCREIFNWTTYWFKDHEFDQREGNKSSNPTLYMQLVAAHCRMSIYAVGEAWNTMTQKRWSIPEWGDKKKRKIYGLDSKDDGIPVKYDFFNAHVYEIGEAYIENSENKEHGVWNYMRETYFGLEENTVMDAWWVMMLRGIVWSLPIMSEQPGEAVPSSFYNSDIPVWIA